MKEAGDHKEVSNKLESLLQISFTSMMMAGREITLLTFVRHFELPSFSQIVEEISRLKRRNADLTMKLEQVSVLQQINTKCDKLFDSEAHVVHVKLS